ncbi:hypothetical protein BC834DRAFT_879687 [Gloeopeniophorella convolvens]|nr:hypothetical protein BC834DRAFT_879687 [Gloeopeniophorella convolvens]
MALRRGACHVMPPGTAQASMVEQCYFDTIFRVKAMLPKAETSQKEQLINFISGSVEGFAGTVVSTPFGCKPLADCDAQVPDAHTYRVQTVRSRIQGVEKVPDTVPKYNWTYPGTVTISREEGPAALYEGFMPKVLQLAPGGGVLLLVVGFPPGVFRKAIGPPYTRDKVIYRSPLHLLPVH